MGLSFISLSSYLDLFFEHTVSLLSDLVFVRSPPSLCSLGSIRSFPLEQAEEFTALPDWLELEERGWGKLVLPGGGKLICAFQGSFHQPVSELQRLLLYSVLLISLPLHLTLKAQPGSLVPQAAQLWLPALA